MERWIAAAIILALFAGCRGEPVPRDYQNAPPAMTDPPKSKAEAPMDTQIKPQPSTGVEGPNPTNEPVTPPTDGPVTTTVEDQAPVTNT